MRGQVVDALAFQIDRPLFGCQNTADGVKRCRLARAIGADEGDDFALFHRQGNPLQCVDAVVIGVDVFECEHRINSEW